MTAPVGRELHVDRELTTFAMNMKYSCQLGRLSDMVASSFIKTLRRATSADPAVILGNL
jgi:hypothetical protein